MFTHISAISEPGTLVHAQLVCNAYANELQIIDFHIFFPRIKINADVAEKQLKPHIVDLIADLDEEFVGNPQTVEVKSAMYATFTDGDLRVASDGETDLEMQILSVKG